MTVTAIIGRRSELEQIDSLLDGVAERPAALFLEGEAGIGKTRLWQEGVERARARGYRVLATRPGGADVRLGFAALSDLLEPVLGDALEALPSPQRRALGAALLLEDTATSVDERAVSAAFLGVVRRVAEEAPVLVALDDVQWLDAASARALEFALRRLEHDRVGVLATVRVAPDVDEPVELRRAIGDERATRIQIGALNVAALYELVRDRFGVALSRPTLLRLHDASAGNPFFALELARALVDAELEPAPGEPLPVPREIRRLLSDRLSRLSGRANDVLLAAAASSNPTTELVEAALGWDAGDAIREAVAAGTIELDGRRIRFAHPLIAAARYAEASPTERRAVHACLAAVSRTDEGRASHLARASEGPDEAVARALDQGSERAAARGDVVSAAALAADAVAATPAEDAVDLHRRRLAAARLAFVAGASEQTESLLAAALEAAAPGAARAAVLYELGNVRMRTMDTRVALELYRSAASEAAPDPVLRSRILQRQAMAEGFWGGGFAAAAAAAREALALAEQVGEPLLLSDALATYGDRMFWLGHGIPHDELQRAEALEQASGGSRLDGASFAYAWMLERAGDFDGARSRYESLVAIGRSTGDVQVARVILALASLDWHQGSWDRSEELVHEATALTEQAGWEVVEAGAVFALAQLDAARGDVAAGRARALAALEQTERTGRLSGGPRSVLGVIELSVENHAGAWEQLAPALERYRARGAGIPLEQDFDAVEALAGAGRVDEARALLDEFEQKARRSEFRWAVAAATRCRGLVAAAAGDLESALVELRAATALAEEVPMPLDLGRTLLARGTVERRLQRKRDARDTLLRAANCFESLGASVWAERARAELARIGGRSAARQGLTASEERIAALVRAGHTNREVAAALHLSTHTVEWNLTRIYRKLGVRSRTELAAASTHE